MTGITHKQVQRYLRADLDGLLRDKQRRDLHTHLLDCEACRVESELFSTLTERLQTNLHARWDTQDGPSENVLSNIQSRSRRIIMSNRINVGLRTLAGIAALVVFVVLFNVLIKNIKSFSINPATEINPAASDQLQPTSTIATETASGPEFQLDTGKSNGDLIVYTVKTDGNTGDIYTMSTNGSGKVNLTNHPANDSQPAWSPDGKRIAFISDRTGNDNIFLMNPDGSDLFQLTKESGYIYSLLWSPDGQKIAFSESISNDPNIMNLYVMNADRSNRITLTAAGGSYYFGGWSPDNQTIIYQYQKEGSSDTIGSVIFAVNHDGTNTRELLKDAWLDGQIQWQDGQHLIATTWTGASKIYQFSMDGTAPIILAYRDVPIPAWFWNKSDVTYINKSWKTWKWYPANSQDNTKQSKPLSVWTNFAENCEHYIRDYYIGSPPAFVSPNGKHALVILHCDEGSNWLYFINADGTEIRLLLELPASQNLYFWVQDWSPDGKQVLIHSDDNQGKNAIYLLDLEQALLNPSTQLIPLITDPSVLDAFWQPALDVNMLIP